VTASPWVSPLRRLVLPWGRIPRGCQLPGERLGLDCRYAVVIRRGNARWKDRSEPLIGIERIELDLDPLKSDR
jgi:hypothetical protein